MTETKTKPTGVLVGDFIAAVEHAGRRADAMVLDALFRKVTGFVPHMWGPGIIGYGRYDYVYDSGHSGSAPATGFSPRKANMVVYILTGYLELGDRLARLGKHKIGKSCLYLGKLADVDMAVLEEIIRAGLDDLAKRHAIAPA